MVYSSFNDSGVSNFDVNLYSGGIASSPYGATQGQMGPQYPTYGVQSGPNMAGHPQNDAFIRREEEGPKHFGSSFKKYLTGAVVGALTLLGISKLRPDWISSLSSGKSTKAIREAKETARLEALKIEKEKKKMKSEILDELGEGKKSKTKIKAEEGFFSKIGENLRKLPKWGKIVGGSALGLIALGGIFKLATGSKIKNESETENKIEHQPQTKES